MTYQIQAHTTPNKSSRGGVAPHFFVMHVTEGGFDGAVSWLCNPAAQASADEVVSLDGKRVAVLNTAATKLKTWAVGNGNPQSMSWENEGHGGSTIWPSAHYDTLADRLIKAQAAVFKVYGVHVPLKRTTSPNTPGICGHGDMARWFGGSDHFGCPGSTFSFTQLDAAITRALGPKPPAYTKADLQKWARWYLGVGEFKGHARDKQLRPKRIPAKVPPMGWKILTVLAKKQPVKPAPSIPSEYVEILDHTGKVILSIPEGKGRVEKATAAFPWIIHARKGRLTVRVVQK